MWPWSVSVVMKSQTSNKSISLADCYFTWCIWNLYNLISILKVGRGCSHSVSGCVSLLVCSLNQQILTSFLWVMLYYSNGQIDSQGWTIEMGKLFLKGGNWLKWSQKDWNCLKLKIKLFWWSAVVGWDSKMNHMSEYDK